MALCECGCEKEVIQKCSWYKPKYINGHWIRNNITSLPHMFKKGHIPHNKNKKIPIETLIELRKKGFGFIKNDSRLINNNYAKGVKHEKQFKKGYGLLRLQKRITIFFVDGELLLVE